MEATIEVTARDFLSGWVVGYLEAGGSLTDGGLAERAVKAYERRLHPPDMPEPFAIRLEAAIAAAQDVAQRSALPVPSPSDTEEKP
jgi:hypothetical protein